MKTTFRNAENGFSGLIIPAGKLIISTISVDTNDSLADISELNGERESDRTNSKGDSSWHDDSDVRDQQSDDDHTEEASTSLGNRKEKRNSKKAKAKVSSIGLPTGL